jgi:hypothetical protein
MLPICTVGQRINYNFYLEASAISVISAIDLSAGFPIYRVRGEERPVFHHNINNTVELEGKGTCVLL